MVALPNAIETSAYNLNPTEGRKKINIPEGEYVGVMLGSAYEPSPFSKDKPQGIGVDFVITTGDHRDTKFHLHLGVSDLSIIGENGFTAQMSANTYIAQLVKSFGYDRVPDGFDLDTIRNKPLILVIKTKEGLDKKTNTKKPEWNESYIKGFKPAPNVGTVAPFGAPAAVVANPATSALSGQVGGVSTPPWAK